LRFISGFFPLAARHCRAAAKGGETRQSIVFRKRLDARVKPAHDG
jgi:hypothetical protein